MNCYIEVKIQKLLKEDISENKKFINSEGKHKLLANKQMNNLLNIVDIEGFNLLKKYNEND
jgi:hypothetical protein